ncbi:MFS transporter [Homoserinibacter sp. YIM 151385]|uniref:MFS transporter n=1 Tax=Homoserinibacter sp. YIM 151385 TaxID=2985506 RepID=UPI0022EFE83D|nr:MFS transporter [Homoserinibacter sp. YIM 151385]WBU37202.1 MFS transporter [Homoserinibacter sp. YIM 151385]
MTDTLAPDAPPASPAARRPRPLALVIIAASLPMFMATLDNLVMTNALPVLHRELGAGVEELQWFVNAYTLVFASLILVASALGDRLGRRRVFLAGIVIFALGSALAALSTDPSGLIAARALQGVGGAALMPLSLALLTGATPPERRPLAIGIWGGISGLGVALGPLVGGIVMEGWDWQAIFWLNIPVAIVAIPLVLWALPEQRGARVPLDLPGAALAALGVLAVVHTTVRGTDDGWDSPTIALEYALGGILLVAFVLWQRRRGGAALIPLALFRDRAFTLVNLIGFAFSFGAFGAIFLLIQYLQVVHGSTPLEAAVQTTPWTLMPMLIAPLAGMIAPRVGTRALLVGGVLLQGSALVWLALVMSPTVEYSALVAPFVVAGIGMSLFFAPSATALLATLRGEDHAKASGVNATLREMGIVLGTAVLTAIFTNAGGQLTPELYVDAARPAVLVGGLVALAAVVAAALLPHGRTPRSPAPASDPAESSDPDRAETAPEPQPA